MTVFFFFFFFFFFFLDFGVNPNLEAYRISVNRPHQHSQYFGFFVLNISFMWQRQYGCLVCIRIVKYVGEIQELIV